MSTQSRLRPKSEFQRECCFLRVSFSYLLLIYWVLVPGVIVLQLARCRENKGAFLRELGRSPSNRSVMSAASTASASSSSSASRPNLPAGGNSKIQRKEMRLAGQHCGCPPGLSALQLNSRSRRPGSDLTPTSAKLTRQRSSREARRSSKEADGECPFEKFNREGGLLHLPCADPGDAKELLEKFGGQKDRICRATGKNWSKEWSEQREAWIQSSVHRPLHR